MDSCVSGDPVWWDPDWWDPDPGVAPTHMAGESLSVTLDQLPESLLALILGNLPWSSVVAASCTCRALQRAVSALAREGVLK